VWIVSGFAAKHKVLNRESFPYILSFSDELQKSSPLNDLMYMVCHHKNHCYNNPFKVLNLTYHTVKNFGGEKTLANLANHNNSPTFFANFPVFVTQGVHSNVSCTLVLRKDLGIISILPY